MLLLSTKIDPANRRMFWISMTVLVIFGAGVYIYYSITSRVNPLKIAQEIVALEYAETGRQLKISDRQIELLDSETLLFAFESGPHMLAYKYIIPTRVIVGPIEQKIGEVKKEFYENEINLQLARSAQERESARRKLEFQTPDGNN